LIRNKTWFEISPQIERFIYPIQCLMYSVEILVHVSLFLFLNKLNKLKRTPLVVLCTTLWDTPSQILFKYVWKIQSDRFIDFPENVTFYVCQIYLYNVKTSYLWLFCSTLFWLDVSCITKYFFLLCGHNFILLQQIWILWQVRLGHICAFFFTHVMILIYGHNVAVIVWRQEATKFYIPYLYILTGKVVIYGSWVPGLGCLCHLACVHLLLHQNIDPLPKLFRRLLKAKVHPRTHKKLPKGLHLQNVAVKFSKGQSLLTVEGKKRSIEQICVYKCCESWVSSVQAEKEKKEEDSTMMEQWRYSDVTSGQRTSIKIVSRYGWWDNNCSK
jgi:hypothetical protein